MTAVNKRRRFDLSHELLLVQGKSVLLILKHGMEDRMIENKKKVLAWLEKRTSQKRMPKQKQPTHKKKKNTTMKVPTYTSNIK